MVSKEVYQDQLISRLLPAITEKWPRRHKLLRKIFIQRDGAKNHICEDDKLFNNALKEQSINANSTCKWQTHLMLTCWIWFFRAIQSFNNAVPKNKEELIQAVSVVCDSYPWIKINHTWLTLQCCFNQVLMCIGDNDYKHISKDKLECTGQLPNVLNVVEDMAQIFHTNAKTNNTNDEINEEETQTNT